MAQVYLSLGSNIERERYIGSALDALAEAFGELTVSSVYESEAVGFDGDPFFNLVVGIDTELPLAELFALLRNLEHDHDRCRNAVKFSARTLDIDILTYDDFIGRFELADGTGGELPRGEITANAFVLWPLAEIAPQQQHPLLKRAYQQLWDDYDRSAQQLRPVAFEWQGRPLPLL